MSSQFLRRRSDGSEKNLSPSTERRSTDQGYFGHIWARRVALFVWGVYLTDSIGRRVTAEHDDLTCHVHHMVMPLIGNEVPGQSLDAFMDARGITGGHPLQFLTRLSTKRAD